MKKKKKNGDWSSLQANKCRRNCDFELNEQ